MINKTLLALGAMVLAVAPVSGQAADTANAPKLVFTFAETVLLAKDIPVGQTERGHRNIIPITGGHFEGPDIRGTIMPGGWDWQLQLANGCTQVKADYFLKTDDGVVINILNTGTLCPPKDGEDISVFTHPVFEAPEGKYEALSNNTYIGTLAPAKGPNGEPAVKISIYQVVPDN
ncbi:DUF3237 family protein [Altererythrobacter indicus]|uniref:DUF3237 family protein n=1 Tax=Altericroceibacterium indicum TaxID=374177 RepID=A0A845ABU1_9SPHN|nr:DUF3237 domain-containing protein [Altericroceibacterium indicum]MXP26713.1 DUF3237 family protein [Altericroceibacterium indicum]